MEETRKVNKTNVFSINNQRFDRTRRDRFIVFFNDQHVGEATPLNLQQNAKTVRENLTNTDKQGAQA